MGTERAECFTVSLKYALCCLVHYDTMHHALCCLVHCEGVGTERAECWQDVVVASVNNNLDKYFGVPPSTRQIPSAFRIVPLLLS